MKYWNDWPEKLRQEISDLKSGALQQERCRAVAS